MKCLPLVLALSVLTLSCAKDKGPPPPAPHRASAHETVPGSLPEKMQKIRNGKHRSECDEKVDPIRERIATALEARKSEIEEYKKKNSMSSEYRVVPFGPTVTQERITPPSPPSGWQSDTTTYQELDAIRAEAEASGSIKFWAALDSGFRGLIDDEVYRVAGVNYQLGHQTLPAARALRDELEACRANPACTTATLSEGSRAFVESQLSYKQYYEKVLAAPAGETREWMIGFADWVKPDVAFYDFAPNPTVKAAGTGQWILPIDPGPFASASEQYHRYFNELWQTGGGKVSLEFLSSPDVYRTVLGTEYGGRSYVNLKKKEIVFNPALRARTVAHELGHVLGFKDLYFQVWKPSDCSWETQFRPDDVMSNSATGGVLPEHWSKLSEAYR